MEGDSGIRKKKKKTLQAMETGGAKTLEIGIACLRYHHTEAQALGWTGNLPWILIAKSHY